MAGMPLDLNHCNRIPTEKATSLPARFYEVKQAKSAPACARTRRQRLRPRMRN